MIITIIPLGTLHTRWSSIGIVTAQQAAYALHWTRLHSLVTSRAPCPLWHLEGRLASACGSSGHHLYISAFGSLGNKSYPKVISEEGTEPKPSDRM
ncbi:hypothetical protein FRC11_008578 [Ceratobasidium sp. 423]|nr:hypothetical protein FRC11_008578 [Ceratobasidium sp. 423]